jgi:hypothetical protein
MAILHTRFIEVVRITGESDGFTVRIHRYIRELLEPVLSLGTHETKILSPNPMYQICPPTLEDIRSGLLLLSVYPNGTGFIAGADHAQDINAAQPHYFVQTLDPNTGEVVINGFLHYTSINLDPSSISLSSATGLVTQGIDTGSIHGYL